jgi:ankyrin repeat protein
MPGTGETPLHLASQQPGGTAALLLESGADPEARDAAGLTALQHAVCGAAPVEACTVLLKVRRV